MMAYADQRHHWFPPVEVDTVVHLLGSSECHLHCQSSLVIPFFADVGYCYVARIATRLCLKQVLHYFGLERFIILGPTPGGVSRVSDSMQGLNSVKDFD